MRMLPTRMRPLKQETPEKALSIIEEYILYINERSNFVIEQLFSLCRENQDAIQSLAKRIAELEEGGDDNGTA